MYYDKSQTRGQPMFSLGQVVATANAHSQLTQEDITHALDRHCQGDWGDVCPEDWKSNDEAIQFGERLVSSYKSATGVKFWIITEWDRSITTVLLPEDY
jgi:hypothetical protein